MVLAMVDVVDDLSSSLLLLAPHPYLLQLRHAKPSPLRLLLLHLLLRAFTPATAAAAAPANHHGCGCGCGCGWRRRRRRRRRLSVVDPSSSQNESIPSAMNKIRPCHYDAFDHESLPSFFSGCGDVADNGGDDDVCLY